MAAGFEFKKWSAVRTINNMGEFRGRFNNDEIDWLLNKFEDLQEDDCSRGSLDDEEIWPRFRLFLNDVIALAECINSVFVQYDIDFEPDSTVEGVLNRVADGLSGSEVDTARSWIRRTEDVQRLIDREISQNEPLQPLWSKAQFDVIDGLSGKFDGIRWEGDDQQLWREITYVFRLLPKPKPVVGKVIEDFQVFVSYKRRRNALAAARLVDYLRSLGFSVWFDDKVLALQGQAVVNKQELAKFIISAVRSCPVTVVFEAQMEAAAIPEEYEDAEELNWSGEVMLVDGVQIAWNWQKLEIDNAKRLIAISPTNRVTLGNQAVSSWSTEEQAFVAVGVLVSQLIVSPTQKP
ncbi:hypothetical protein P9A16_27060 [Shinella sp. 838]|uniref:hypothetical protein n=1 Tax=Shinella sp. 838 TaxID=3038164 RepID=UPI002415797A|nr:hypothetical protein [Shinella sp. 838]MDG4674791.1 hypothetical protein [Shinella sp. 838]